MTAVAESSSCCPCITDSFYTVVDWTSTLLNTIWECYRSAVRFFCEMLFNCGLEMIALTLSTWLTEPCAALYAAIWYPLGWQENFNHYGLNPTEITAAEVNRRAIILIHGRYSNPSTFLDLAKHFQERGIGPVYTIKTYHYDVTEADVQIVKDKFEEIAAQYAAHGAACPGFDLVGHSRGAWVATKTLERDDRVARVFRIANPTQAHELEVLPPDKRERIYDVRAGDDIIFLEAQSALPPHRVHHVPSGHLGAVHHSSSVEHLCHHLS